MNQNSKRERARVEAVFTAGVLSLTLIHPGKRNALTWEMFDQLGEHLDAAAALENLRAITITGDADGGFAAGTDIAQFLDFDGAADGLEYEHRTGRLLSQLQAMPVPTIAVVAGAAVGAGLAIAACCDLIVAARGAKFGVPIARTLGNCLPSPVIARLVARMGQGWTTTMLMTARIVPAEDLVAVGFVSNLVEADELHSETERILVGLRASAPLTLRGVKETLQSLSEPVADNDAALALCYGSDDFREGVAAFTEKRAPNWKGK